MNFRITAVLILALAMAGCSKTQASKPVTIKPLTGDEKFMILNQPQVAASKRKAANETTEAAAMRVAEKAFTDTKEYKAAVIANEAAEKARKAANDTKEAKAATAAQAVAEQTEAAKAVMKIQDEQNNAINALFAERGLKQNEYIICGGPSTKTADGKSLGETCKGVAENDYEFRAIKK